MNEYLDSLDSLILKRRIDELTRENAMLRHDVGVYPAFKPLYTTPAEAVSTNLTRINPVLHVACRWDLTRDEVTGQLHAQGTGRGDGDRLSVAYYLEDPKTLRSRVDIPRYLHAAHERLTRMLIEGAMKE